MATRQTREATGSISIRIKTRQRDLIDRAAERLNRSRSEFMTEVACREAESVLLDQVFFQVDAPTFDAFRTLLDNAPDRNEGLARLFATRPPWA